MLDKCDTSHFGISQIVHMILKHRYCYVDHWYEYDAMYSNTWVKQSRGEYKLRIALSTDVSNAYGERAAFWYRKSLALSDEDDAEHAKKNYMDIYKVLFKISNSLKQYDFKSTIIRESRCLFWVDKLPVLV